LKEEKGERTAWAFNGSNKNEAKLTNQIFILSLWV